MITQLDTENADRNLTSQVTVLTHTPSATEPTLCQALVQLGDGTKNLDGTGGDFELTIIVGGQTVQPDPQTITFSTATRVAVWSTVFPVAANQEVVVKIKSPNAADTDVDTTAYLYDASANKVDVVKWLGTAPATPNVAGIPQVDVTYAGGSAATGVSSVDANIVSVDGKAISAVILHGTVDGVTFTSTTTEFESDDITTATTSHYKGRVIVFRTGTLAGQACLITAYSKVGSNGHFTVSTLTSAPANDVEFDIY